MIRSRSNPSIISFLPQEINGEKQLFFCSTKSITDPFLLVSKSWLIRVVENKIPIANLHLYSYSFKFVRLSKDLKHCL